MEGGGITMNEISAKELQEKLEKGESLYLIDVREEDEVSQGIIPGAKHIRLSEIPERMNELDKDKHYYMVCRSGGRSGRATEFLKEQGYQVTNMSGGMLAWEGDVE